MYFTAKQLMGMLNIKKIKYVSLNHAGNLVCSHPSTTRGVSHKYSKDDVLKNSVIIELIDCGITHKEAFKLAQNDEAYINDMFISSIGTTSEIRIPLSGFQQIIEEFEG